MKDSSRIGVILSIVALVVALLFVGPSIGLGHHWHIGRFFHSVPWIAVALILFLCLRGRGGCCRRRCGDRVGETEDAGE